MVRVEKKDIKLVRDVGGQAFQMTLNAAAQFDEDRELLRRRMYDAQVQDGKFMPGPMSKYDPKKEAEQKSCCHPFKALKWGGNKTSRYATCSECGLKSCVLYRMEEDHNEAHC